MNYFVMIERVRIFKLGKIYAFKHFFNDRIYRLLSEFYNKKTFRFECSTTAERNKIYKLLDKNGYEVEIVDNLDGYLVSIDAGRKYALVLKNSIAHKKAGSRIVFLLKDENAVEAALRQGAELYRGENRNLL